MWRAPIAAVGDTELSVDGKQIGYSSAAAPENVAWGDLGCDIVLQCTGKFLTPEHLQAYFDRGVQRVIVAAPVKDARALNIVVGVGRDYDDVPPLRGSFRGAAEQDWQARVQVSAQDQQPQQQQ